MDSERELKRILHNQNYVTEYLSHQQQYNIVVNNYTYVAKFILFALLYSHVS